jgi:hypothetical protein
MSTIESFAPLRRRPSRLARRLAAGYIVSPLYDWAFFIGAPLIALALGLLLSRTAWNEAGAAFDYRKSWVDFGIGVFIFAHLVIVIFRSHLNPRVFRLHRLRFTLVPLALFAAMMSSNWILISCSVLATFWDVYHSGMQTFGLCRIYDARAGNPPRQGRTLDWILNLYLYAGPIAAGAALMPHMRDFDQFGELGAVFFTAIPAHAESNAQILSWLVIGTGLPFLGLYVWRYWRLHRAGYEVSPQKIAILTATGLCSIWAWGFNPFGMAFFIMNFFHALQYFAIMWWAEKGNISRILGCEGRSWARPAALLVLLVVGLAYGIVAEQADIDTHTHLFALFLLVSLMHFWYDSFIWSVARKQI